MVMTLVKLKVNVLTTVAILIIASIFTSATLVHASEELKEFFSKDYAGISLRAEATNETIPGGNLTLKIWINCTARGVKIEHLSLNVYGFVEGKEKTLLYNAQVLNNTALELDEVRYENFNISLPVNVWGCALAEISVAYSIMDTPLPSIYPSFPITFIRNIAYEELQKEYEELSEFCDELNETFFENFQMNLTIENLAKLNNTLKELQGRLGELNTTRVAVGVLAIIAFFFVITTLYLAVRKPKQYW
jgi:cell division protein ZapA (FtsZ GTPase activity inhibitor)